MLTYQEIVGNGAPPIEHSNFAVEFSFTSIFSGKEAIKYGETMIFKRKKNSIFNIN
jgi:hypothetical protein